MLLLQVLDALLADHNAFGRLEDLLLNDQRCLPALHPVLLVDEVGRFGPHTTDMLEVVLKVLYNCFLLCLFLFLNVLKILSVFQISQLVRISLHLTLLEFEALSLEDDLLDAVKLIVILNLKHGILPQFLHIIEHFHSETTGQVWVKVCDPKASYPASFAHIFMSFPMCTRGASTSRCVLSGGGFPAHL